MKKIIVALLAGFWTLTLFCVLRIASRDRVWPAQYIYPDAENIMR